MGNQGHSGEGVRLIKEWIADGAIGPVHEVHAWTNRPGGFWPTNIGRPKDTPSVPATLNWDLWVGPAPMRPYHPIYLPNSWRAWWNFGTGALGDMGCHIIDNPYWALDLDYPTSVEASSTGFNNETDPAGALIHYEFPARGDMPPVTLHWYDGGLLPKRPAEFELGRSLSRSGSGVILLTFEKVKERACISR